MVGMAFDNSLRTPSSRRTLDKMGMVIVGLIVAGILAMSGWCLLGFMS
jgi:hypothetical protein